MSFLYNIFVTIVGFLLKPVAFFNKKIAYFLNGRKETFQKLQAIQKEDKVIWIHVASLGEFEQGRPIIEAIKADKKFKNHKIVLTFFSPSGYEIRKNYALADVVCYLPLDTKQNVRKFVNTVHPEMAIFVKYEFWPNLLKELKKQQIPTIVVSAIFRENQLFFQNNFIGKFMRNSLQSITHFFVQNSTSKKLLKQLNFTNVSVCSDTRFDRVYQIVNQNNKIEKIVQFLAGFNGAVFVAGSTWEKDENILVNYINKHSNTNEKYIIAPHLMDQKKLQILKENFGNKVQFFSDKTIDKDAQVLLVDTIGLLSKIYSYATIAYVGGGFGVGIHNILEPATFGIPVIIGTNYKKFKEAKDLVEKGGCFVVKDENEFHFTLKKLKDKSTRLQAGRIADNYIKEHLGGTNCILSYLKQKLY